MTPRIRLRALEPALKDRVWESREKLRIGRLKTFEISLQDKSVSRQQAEIVYTTQGWIVRDLGSRNGSFLNGKPVGRADEKLQSGDNLQFGDISMAVDVSDGPPPFNALDCYPGLAVHRSDLLSWDDLTRHM